MTAVLFCVSLNEYDLGLEEDGRVNRMHESLQLFQETCSSPFFAEASIILFLNKDDLFRDKIKKVDLKCCFSDYTGKNLCLINSHNLGGKNYEPALQHIKSKFRSDLKTVYPHVSIATDTENVRFIFQAVLDTILSVESRKDWVV